MNKLPEINNGNFRELALILDEIREKGKFMGIIIANKDGEIMNENIGNKIDCQKLASMCASVLESATRLGDTTGNQEIVKILAELDDFSILIIEIKEKRVFLVFIINNQADSSFIFDNLEDYIQKIGLLI